MNKLETAQRALEDAKVRRAEAARALQNVADETVEEIDALNASFDEADEEVIRTTAEVTRQERLNDALEATAVPAATTISVTRNESPYRKGEGTSYFGDLYRALKQHDYRSEERLRANDAYVTDTLSKRGVEMRDVTDTSAAGFIPPIWMADEWAEFARPGRPVADRIQKLPLPPDGLTSHIPKVSTGTLVNAQAIDGNVADQDMTSTTADATMVTVAGQTDVDRQVLERSAPGLDMVLFDDLMRAYDAELDRQILVGVTASHEHLGLASVPGINSVTYDDNSPTGSALLTKVYGAISQIYSKRYYAPTGIYMHPRRAAWLAATQASTFPLFQQGGLFHAAGTQDNGITGTFAGLPVVIDANIPTNLGSTTEDEILVVYEPDFRLAEGPLRQATYEDVLSGKLAVRLQLFAFSFFWGNRFPQSITKIVGTGLVAPVGF